MLKLESVKMPILINIECVCVGTGVKKFCNLALLVILIVFSSNSNKLKISQLQAASMLLMLAGSVKSVKNLISFWPV